MNEQQDLIEEAVKLANDIDEYLPDSNISSVIRRLIYEIERLQREKNRPVKSAS